MSAKQSFKKFHRNFRSVCRYERQDATNSRVYEANAEWRDLCEDAGDMWVAYNNAAMQAVAWVRNPKPMTAAEKVATLKDKLRAEKGTDFFSAING